MRQTFHLGAPTGDPSVATEGSVTVRVPAKINIRLEVGPLRPDGFHSLRTLFHAVDLYDTVTASPADTLSLSIGGTEGADLPVDSGNLAWRAAQLLADRAGIEPRVALHVDKRIPVAAGLAGGSADAAGVLAACAALWGLPDVDLDALAAELGSDVTFALHGGSAYGTGRGEVLSPVLGSGEFHWVLAAAHGELSTPAVYAELDRQRSSPLSSPHSSSHSAARNRAGSVIERGFGPHNGETGSDGLAHALRAGDPVGLAGHTDNDLQPAALALAPYLRTTLDAGLALGALAGLVSGSGPTCAFLAADRAHAEQLATALAATGSCRFARAVVGGVPGALDQRTRTAQTTDTATPTTDGVNG